MKKQPIAIIVTLACLILVGAVGFLTFRQTTSRHLEERSASTNLEVNSAGSKTSNNFDSLPTVRISTIVRYHSPSGSRVVHLFKSTNFPPITAEEKTMWEWWDSMDKVDPYFQWKMPIEFYGKVIDQFTQPVAMAEVRLGRTTAIGPIPDPTIKITADANGNFQLTNVQGKVLWVSVDKNGYVPTRTSQGDYEYASFYQENFHVPDPNNPVIFRLHKLLETEPLFVFSIDKHIAPGGPPLILNVEKGKILATGDLAFSVSLGKTNRYGSDFSVNIQAMNGAGLVLSDEEFLSKAPETGYLTELRIWHQLSETNYNKEQGYRFYVRTSTGKFASVGGSIRLWDNLTNADFGVGIHYNPSGSRNLEFDKDKWINR